MSNWSGVDYFIFFIFFLNTILGIVRGSTREIISTMCLAVALIFTIKFALPMTGFINASPYTQSVLTSQYVQNFVQSIGAGPLSVLTLQQIAYCISILICFVGAFGAGEAVFAFTGIVEVYPFPYAFLDRKLSGVLGCVRGYVIALVFMLVLKHFFYADPIQNSYFMNLFQTSIEKMDSIIHQQNPDKYHEIFDDKNKYNVQDIYQTLGS